MPAPSSKLFAWMMVEVKPVVAAIYQGKNPMAAILSATIGGNLITLQTFHDPSLKRVSVGRLLIKMAYEWALENNLAEIDFNATSPWQRPIATGSMSTVNWCFSTAYALWQAAGAQRPAAIRVGARLAEMGRLMAEALTCRFLESDSEIDDLRAD